MHGRMDHARLASLSLGLRPVLELDAGYALDAESDALARERESALQQRDPTLGASHELSHLELRECS